MADDNNPKKAEPRIRIITNGPYIVTGGLPLGTDIIVSSQFGHGLKWRRFPPQGYLCTVPLRSL
jgi:hypothetical protein